jgi:hypothetical protein
MYNSLALLTTSSNFNCSLIATDMCGTRQAILCIKTLADLAVASTSSKIKALLSVLLRTNTNSCLEFSTIFLKSSHKPKMVLSGMIASKSPVVLSIKVDFAFGN